MPTPTAPPQMGYSASQLLQTNNILEAEICRLKNQILAEQGQHQIENQRCQMLQQELRNAQIQRDNANKKVNEVMSERRMMIEMKTDLANRINGLEVANRMLRDDVAAAKRETEGKNEEIRAITYQSEIVRQQINALNERNAALKTKCETMVAQQRRQYEEDEAKAKFMETAQLNFRKAETDLQCANLEIQRLLRELDNSQQMESTSVSDKRTIEEILKRKEDEIRVAVYKSTTDLKAANEKIEKLENRLKQEKPAVHSDMTVFQESIYIAIETIKSTYEKQLSRLEEEIEEMRQQKDIEDGKKMEQNEHQMEELPEYLQTPMKPDPAKMGGVKKTIQCKINLDSIPNFPQSSASSQDMDLPPRPASGPPMDSPVTWHQRKLERLPAVVVPLFGTSGLSEAETSSEPMTSTPDDQLNRYTEEDLLEPMI